MHDTHRLLDARARRTLVERIRPAQTRDIAETVVSAWHVTDPDGVKGQGEPVAFATALAQDYEPFALGETWGPVWGTTWFRIEVDLPADRANLELDIDLGWEDHSPGFQAEGLVYTPEGTVIKAINPRNAWVTVPEDAPDHLVLYIEAAANPLLLGVPPFQKTYDGDKLTASARPIHVLRRAHLVRVDHEVRQLAFDVEILSELALTMPEGSQERQRLTLGLHRALDRLDLDDISSSAPGVREELRPLLETKALPQAHHLAAVGHAHIDSAWLWPLRETRRKVVRTISNVLRLLDDGHEMIFALPAAQHVAWLEEDAPDVFERLRHWVKAGRIVPVGGMWVEPDAQLPGGEAMCRQLLYGQRYFADKLGVVCEGIWLPDSFGYSPALPQIGHLGGADWFLTQKISWNQTDVFPHHTLWWEGIDGTRLFTHFPPVDTYGAEITPHQVVHAATNFKDKGKATCSLLPYGYGDGGGGPTRDMLERATRLADLAGAPTLAHETPHDFFAAARAEYDDAPVWVGELYLELHRGTSTTQANTKLGNREAESALREAETWLTHAARSGLIDYPYAKLEAAWRDTLLAQFHDILPGTSIAWVYRDVEEMLDRVVSVARDLASQARQAIADASGRALDFNAAPVPARGITALGTGQATPASRASVTPSGDGWEIRGDKVCARIGADGTVTSLVGADGRESIPPERGLGELWLYTDFPNMWDAWDVDEFYRGTGRRLEATRVEADETSVTVTWEFAKSVASITYTIDEEGRALAANVDVDWRENEKLLKWHLPLDVHTDHATYETQMGYHTRPIHDNTTWESNKFEVCTHRWIHVGEPGWGVGVTNSATYGWSHARHARPGGGTYVDLAASLLRAPVFPDPEADRGHHTRTFHLLPGADIAETRACAYRTHLPVHHHEPNGEAILTDVAPLVGEVDGLVVEAIKMAEDRSGDVIVRAYEADGRRRRATIALPGASSVESCDLLEGGREGLELPAVEFADGVAGINVHPFEIVTLRVGYDSCD